MNYRYSLQRYTNQASRERCPNCQKAREYTRYIDSKKNELLPYEYGICNRKDKCGYHLSPYHKNASGESYAETVAKSEAFDISLCLPKHNIKPTIKREAVKVYFDTTIAEKTQHASYYAKNPLYKFMCSIAEEKRVLDAFLAYKVGTCSKGTVFWFLDNENQYHAGQVKDFNIETGKTTNTTWMHTVLHEQDNSASWLKKYYDQDEKVGCLFGEHLIDLPENKDKVIVLVESPKNALMCQVFLPRIDAIYLATYSLSAFTQQRCDAIIGRKIQLIPDLGRGTDAWKQNAQKFLPAGSYAFLDVLEKVATDEDRKEGRDIADFIIASIKGKQPNIISHEAYCSELELIDDVVIRTNEAGHSYPATWDCTAPYVSQETKDYLNTL